MRPAVIFALGLASGVVLTLGTVKRSRHPASPTSIATSSDPATVATHASNPPATDTTNTPAPKRSLAENIALVRKAAETGLGREMEGDEVSDARRAWSEHDPLAVLTFISSVRNFPERLQALGDALSVLSRRDPAGAARWMTANLDSFERGTAGLRLVWDLGTDSPAQALQIAGLLQIKDGEALGCAIAALGTKDPQAALAGFAQLSTGEQSSVASRLTAAWAQNDFNGALQWCESQASQKHFPAALEGLLGGCLEHHPENFAELLQRFTGAELAVPTHAVVSLLDRDTAEGLKVVNMLLGATRIEALAQWGQHALSRDPDGVIAAMRNTLSEEQRVAVMQQAFPGWLYSDRRAAVAWLERQPEGTEKQALLTAMAMDQAQSDPRGALLQLEAKSPTDDVRSAAETALQSWASNDPAAAAQWAKTNWPRTTPAAITAITEQFMTIDESAAATWLAGLPSGATRDEAVAQAARLWAAQGDTDLATQTALSISDPQRRVGALFTLFQTMTASDAAQGAAWLATQPLSEEVKANWRAIVKTGQ